MSAGLLIEAESGGGDAAPSCDLADREQLGTELGRT
jgi:hypothetical protein